MTEENSLKTLKELREGRAPRGELGGAAGNFVEAQYIAEERLKDEAIKWVKKEVFCDLCEDDFMKFFNITEEDLQ